MRIGIKREALSFCSCEELRSYSLKSKSDVFHCVIQVSM